LVLLAIGCQKVEETAVSPTESGLTPPTAETETESESESETEVEDVDSDGDGLFDADEAFWGSDPANPDSDADGLTDGDEVLVYGTDPVVEDTDGDGYTDGYEVVDRDFDPSVDPWRFNPLLADIPQLEFTLAEPPQVVMYVTESGGTSSSVDVTAGTTTEDSFSTTVSNGGAHGQEQESHWDVGAEAGVDGWKFQGKVTGGYGESSTTTSETSWGYDESASSAIANSYEQTLSQAQENGWELTGGFLYLTLNVTNVGHVGFTVEDFQIVALDDVDDRGTYVTVTTLSADSPFAGFPTFDLAGGETQLLGMTNDIDLGTTKALLADSSGLLMQPGPHRLLDAEGDSFLSVFEQLQGRTATVAIDFGPEYGRPLRFRVATKVERDADGEETGLTMDRLFTRYLGLPYELGEVEAYDPETGALLGTHDHLTMLDGFAQQADYSGYWTVTTSSASVEGSEVYDFSSIVLKAGDLLSLVYVTDEDLDWLGSREEASLGTDPLDADTDGDGLSDGAEVVGGWEHYGTRVFSDPTRLDADDDGLLDPEERARGLDPRSADSDGDAVGDVVDWGAVNAIEVGGGFGCGLTAYGAIGCWGSVASSVSDVLADVPLGEGYIAVSLGYDHACALDSAGSPTCWGNDRLAADTPATPFTAVASGDRFACGLDAAGAISCWGDSGTSSLFTDVPVGVGYTDLVAASFFACALDGVGAVVCWGDTGWTVPGNVPAGTGFEQLTVSDMDYGHSQACAVDGAGAFTCWGDLPSSWEDVPAGMGVPTQVAVIETATCALLADGSLSCWGTDTNGELSTVPDGVFTALDGAMSTFCALRDDGRVVCWGANDRGLASMARAKFGHHQPLMGLGSAVSCTTGLGRGLECWGSTIGTLEQDAPDTTVSEVALIEDGAKYACTITGTGAMTCFGNADSDVVIDVMPGSGHWQGVAVAYSAACAIDMDDANSIECWGSPSSNHVVEHPTKFGYEAVEMTFDTACARTTSGTLDCWGYEDSIALAAPAGAFTQHTINNAAACAVSTDSELVCWGEGETVTDAPTAGIVQVAQQIVGGACALDTRGEIRCWSGIAEPSTVSVPPPFVEIAAGDAHFCAMNGVGQYLCWNGTGSHVTGAPR
jgi:hypothetical protein